MNHKLVTLVGPSASGKTALAIELARKYHGQIVCADSRTIYQGMDIGTAKPTTQQQKQIKHYMLDIITPNQNFSAKQYKIMAQQAIDTIWQEGELAILVGGSGLYIDAVLFDYQFRHPRLHPALDLDDKSLDELVTMAKSKYPHGVETIDTKNRRRVEQLILKGPTKDEDRQKLKLDTLIIGLCPDQSTLRENIISRTDGILRQGFVEEVKQLRSKYGDDTIALQTTGYLAVNRYLDGEIDEHQLRAEIIKQTMELAKKQLTWFRRNQYISWVKDGPDAKKLLHNYLTKRE